MPQHTSPLKYELVLSKRKKSSEKKLKSSIKSIKKSGFSSLKQSNKIHSLFKEKGLMDLMFNYNEEINKAPLETLYYMLNIMKTIESAFENVRFIGLSLKQMENAIIKETIKILKYNGYDKIITPTQVNKYYHLKSGAIDITDDDYRIMMRRALFLIESVPAMYKKKHGLDILKHIQYAYFKLNNGYKKVKLLRDYKNPEKIAEDIYGSYGSMLDYMLSQFDFDNVKILGFENGYPILNIDYEEDPEY